MLTLMSTTVAFVLALITWAVMLLLPVAEDAIHPLAFFPSLLIFVAGTTGFLCLGLTVLAHRVRSAPPPRAITVAAALIGVAPLVTIAILALRG
jgi:hypothetical protein